MIVWYINIDKDAIPYRFDMRLGGVTWTFEIRYNTEYDFFTADLYRAGVSIVVGEKLVYGQPLFLDEIDGVRIVPRDLSGNSDRVGWNELGTSVFLYLEGEGYEQLDT